ncbi:putative alanyl-tRNA editing protein alaX [[Candida] anglica]
MTSSSIVGALACQKNSFLKSFKTVVVSCLEYVPAPEVSEKSKKAKGKKDISTLSLDDQPKQANYAIEFEDTILFPEGGGQPSDSGSIILPDESVITVSKVLRDKLSAKHITTSPIEPGTPVTLKVDWEKRLDYMQQHTGQHLLSAVFDTYNLETLSWAMGENGKLNYIELPKKVDDNVLAEVNKKVNDLIFDALPIGVVTPDSHGGEIDTSHIPDDYDLSKGIVRIVKIGELDANPCCGTHLTSTSQIQAISLLHQTNIRGGNSKLFFLCGSRVYKYLVESNKIVKGAGSLLSCQSEEVTEKITQLNANYKKALSRESGLLKDIAGTEAKAFFEEFKSATSENEKVEYSYRPDNNQEYMTLLQKELTTLVNTNKGSGVDLDKIHTVTILNGDYPSGTGGSVKIFGPRTEEIASEIKKRLSNIKGGGRGNSFQGKIPKYEKGELESVLQYLDQFRD